MDSLNVVALTGILERDPIVRFDNDTGQARCRGTLRLEEANATTGAVYKLFIPLDAAGKIGEQLAACHGGDVLAITGKLSWQRWTTAKGEEKASLAVFVRQCSVVQAVAVPTGVEEG